jgi:hypothetical protein
MILNKENNGWDLEKVAAGYGYVSRGDFVEDFHVPAMSKLSERAMARIVDGEITHQGPWDVTTIKVAPEGTHWSKRIEIRGLGLNQVYFNPSTDNGANRPFVLDNFYKKLDAITSYVLFDYRDLLINNGEVKLYEIPAEDIRRLAGRGVRGPKKDWLEDGKLGTRTSISVTPRTKAYPEISSMFDDVFSYEKYKFVLGEKK